MTQPDWSGAGGQAGQQPPDQRESAMMELGVRAETLLRRLRDVEEALTDQEWWLMGNVFPEASRLAEVTSLLSVARGELEGFVVDVCGMSVPPTPDPKSAPDDIHTLMGDPMWMSGSREKAVALLRMLVAQTPPMRQYALALQANAERLRVPSSAMDPLGITAERLAEVEDILRQPLG